MVEREVPLPMLPWFPHHFLASTMHFTFEERAVYRTLLDYQWINGILPEDPVRLARAVGVSQQLFDQVWPTVSAKFVRTAEGLMNARMEEHRLQALRRRERQVRGARSVNAQRARGKALTAEALGQVDAFEDSDCPDALRENAPSDGASRTSSARLACAQSTPFTPGERSHNSYSYSNSDSKASHTHSSKRDASADAIEAGGRDVSHETSLLDETFDGPALAAPAVDPFAACVDAWERDVPEVNAPKYREWLASLDSRGRRWSATARLANARWLVTQGDARAQAEVVDFCIRHDFRRLIPLADVRNERHGAGGRAAAHKELLDQMRARADAAPGEDL